MLAIVAAIIFAIAVILDLVGRSYGNLINAGTLTTLGLLFLALHLAPLNSLRRFRR